MMRSDWSSIITLPIKFTSLLTTHLGAIIACTAEDAGRIHKAKSKSKRKKRRKLIFYIMCGVEHK